MASATNATPKPAGDTLTGIRINRAVSQPGAKGKKGFLLWTAAAFPKEVADRIAKAALKHVNPMMAKSMAYRPGVAGPGRAGPTVTKMGRFGGFGDDANLVTVGVDVPAVSDSVTAAVNATDSSAADPSWLSSISSAISAAGQAYLTKTQVDAQLQIFNTNLARAQKGLAPIPTNPSAYGLPTPTVNFGLASGTQSVVLWIAGGLGLVLLLGSLSKSRK
jgi:hypothetical protein